MYEETPLVGNTQEETIGQLGFPGLWILGIGGLRGKVISILDKLCEVLTVEMMRWRFWFQDWVETTDGQLWEGSHPRRRQLWCCPIGGKNEDVRVGMEEVEAFFSVFSVLLPTNGTVCLETPFLSFHH